MSSSWEVIYEKAIRENGSLYFPERLTHKFLEDARRTQGSYIFANQYQNEIVPDEERRFKAHWLHYYKQTPDKVNRFIFIDPAIGQAKHHDYTGVVLVEADCEGRWYLKLANRYRLTPTQIVEKVFELNETFKPNAIGVESVAYQEALLYFLDQEMRRRCVVLPVKGITRTAVSKETRILGLVPRFEWNRIFINQGLVDFEDEYSKFPRGSHDDLLDALASVEELVFYPKKEEPKAEKPHSQADPNYEKWYIQELIKKAAGKSNGLETRGDD